MLRHKLFGNCRVYNRPKLGGLRNREYSKTSTETTRVWSCSSTKRLRRQCQEGAGIRRLFDLHPQGSDSPTQEQSRYCKDTSFLKGAQKVTEALASAPQHIPMQVYSNEYIHELAAQLATTGD